MPRSRGRPLFFFAALSFFGGCAGGGCTGFALTPPDRGSAVYARLPHHVPPAPEAVPFRFAMVHDVIHERYPRQGPAFYQERERLARDRLAVLPPDSEAAYALTDDVAVGLDRTGRTDEAVALMRDKLKRQQALDLQGKDLYTTYANLGEFLVRANLQAMLGGDLAARQRFQEGQDFLRKAFGVNPKAHFGREEWQLVAVDAWLDFGAKAELMRQTDLIGNRLDHNVEVSNDVWIRGLHEGSEGVFGRPYTYDWVEALPSEHWRRLSNEGPRTPEERAAIRRLIGRVGRETPPPSAKGSERGKRSPFDEPAMWIIGEWRLGSGPSPHLALCLGEIMLRVGQRYLAWNCYERAAWLADQFAPKVDAREFLRTHCRARQQAIEKSLLPNEVATLRPKFEAELAFGEAYQRDFQAYTEQKVQAGGNLNDPHFFDEFHAGRPPIASKVGPEEWYAGTRRSFGMTDKFRAFWSWGLLTGGACALAFALLVRRFWRPRPGVALHLTEVPGQPTSGPEPA